MLEGAVANARGSWSPAVDSASRRSSLVRQRQRAAVLAAVVNGEHSYRSRILKYYLNEFRKFCDVIRDSANAEADPHRKAILRNFQRHVGYEFSGQAHNILTPEMTVAEPVYRIKWGEFKTYTGMKTVQGYYDSVNEVVCTALGHQLAVHDWGFASYSTFVRFVKGSELQKEGQNIPKPDDTPYAQHLLMAMFWHYNAEAKLTGEDVFMLTDPQHIEVKPQEVFSSQELAAVALDYLQN
jgi:hypothetical protein